MTAFSLAYERDKVVIAADSLAYVPDREHSVPLGFISKVLSVPHLKLSAFSRGQYQILVVAMADLSLQPSVFTIEDAAELMPDLLSSASAQYCAEQGIDDPRGVGLLEVTLVGWSEAAGRMRLWQFNSREGYEPHNEGDTAYGFHAIPALPERFKPAAPVADLDGKLTAVIQAIGKYFEAEPGVFWNARVGGEIIRTTIEPDGISTKCIYRFEDYAEHLHAGAAVTARYVRGDLDMEGVVRRGLVPADQMVDPPAERKLSRQERRAQERAARKAKAA